MSERRDPVDVALEFEGMVEATGQNDGDPAIVFMDYDPKDPATRANIGPWCAAFVWKCFNLAGRPISNRFHYWVRGLRSASKLAAYMRAEHEWIASSTRVRRNDVVFFCDLGGRIDHVGIVVSKDRTHIATIEGNLGDAVARRAVPVDSLKIAGFARVGGL